LDLIEETLKFFTFKEIINNRKALCVSFKMREIKLEEKPQFVDFEEMLHNYIMFVVFFLKSIF
jgi:hypothetical protein